MNIKNILKIDWLMCLLFICIGMAISVYFRHDNIFDLVNYHLYNPYALLNNRTNDIAPGSLNSFFNPLPDIPFYLMVKYWNDYPGLIFAVQGIWYGLLLFAFFKCCTLFFDVNSKLGILQIFLSLFIAGTSDVVISQAGTSTNDIPIAFFAVAVLYFLLKAIKMPALQSSKLYFICGLVLGAALGLKSTLIFLCVASGLTLIVCAKKLKKPFLYITLFALGGLLGYLALNGWWMYRMWTLYQNPFFPFVNGIFHSPYFDDFNYTDKRFIYPANLFLFAPYLWWVSWDLTPSEGPLKDPRIAIYYTLFIGYLIYVLFNWRKTVDFYKRNFHFFFLLCFIVIGYFLWLFIFSIHRYYIALEMFCAIFLVTVIIKIYPKTAFKQICCTIPLLILGYIMIANSIWFPWGVKPLNDSKYISMEKVTLPPNTLLKLYYLPVAGVIPFLDGASDFQAVGYMGLHNQHMIGSDFTERGAFRKQRDEIEKTHTGPIVIIGTRPTNCKNHYPFLKRIRPETVGKYCRNLRASFDERIFICVPQELKETILIEPLPEAENDKNRYTDPLF